MLMCAYHLMGNLMMGSARHSQLCNHCKRRYCAQQHILRQLWRHCIGILEDEQLNKGAQRCEQAATYYILVEYFQGTFRFMVALGGLVEFCPGHNRTLPHSQPIFVTTGSGGFSSHHTVCQRECEKDYFSKKERYQTFLPKYQIYKICCQIPNLNI